MYVIPSKADFCKLSDGNFANANGIIIIGCIVSQMIRLDLAYYYFIPPSIL